jgi:protein-disulfide isomerase-like protein with CxxC motif
MSQIKMATCCARLAARLVMEKANLGRLAQRESYRHGRGLSTAKVQEEIAEQRTAIASTQQLIVEHEAEHAGQVA